VDDHRSLLSSHSTVRHRTFLDRVTRPISVGGKPVPIGEPSIPYGEGMSHPSDFSHVRWIGGGTGAGKSTVARLLAARYGLGVYDGDRAGMRHFHQFDERRHPYMAALMRLSPEERSTGRSAEEAFAAMPSRHGETFPFVREDLRAITGLGTVLVDDFSIRPADVAPLLTWPEQAVFLLPTPEFRRQALTERYADLERARLNWGDVDFREALENRLARDRCWDAETREQAAEFGLPVVDIDGTIPPDGIADDLAARFRLD
jgi:hypothetical protein